MKLIVQIFFHRVRQGRLLVLLNGSTNSANSGIGIRKNRPLISSGRSIGFD
jgi:hypothetical protein